MRRTGVSARRKPALVCVYMLALRYSCWLLGRWKKNWTIHLDGYFQTNSRNDRGDLVKVARGIRRLSILDTKANDPDESIGAHTDPLSLITIQKSSQLSYEYKL